MRALGNRAQDVGALLGERTGLVATGVAIGDLDDADRRVGAEALEVLLGGVTPEALLQATDDDEDELHCAAASEPSVDRERADLVVSDGLDRRRCHRS